MDIDSFIAKYRAEWDWLDAATRAGPRGVARKGAAHVDDVVAGYLRVCAHLADARTFYGDPGLVAYLDRITTQAHGAVYGARPRSRRDAARMFGVRYRAAAQRALPGILVATAVLVGVSVAMGMLTAWSEEARLGLVPGYVQQVVGDQVSSLRDPSGGLTLFLWVNNARVALFAFALGITLGIGTLFVLVTNAILLGSLAGAAHALGDAGRFYSLVLPHGFLELAAICLAAGAGLHVGWSIVVPGDRTRSAAVAATTRDAVLVGLGAVPALAVAAAIEGLVTGVTGVPAFEVGLGLAVCVGYLAWLFRPMDAAAATTASG